MGGGLSSSFTHTYQARNSTIATQIMACILNRLHDYYARSAFCLQLSLPKGNYLSSSEPPYLCCAVRFGGHFLQGIRGLFDLFLCHNLLFT